MNLFERALNIARSSDYVIKFGRYKNKKLIDIYNHDREYFDWLETLEKEGLKEEIEKLKNNLPK